MVQLGWMDFNLKLKKYGRDYPGLDSFIQNLYQKKTFKTRIEFNRAYDEKDPRINRNRQEVIITPEDISQFEKENEDGEFEDDYTELISKIKALFQCEKIVFFY
jgi:hypothetical protein